MSSSELFTDLEPPAGGLADLRSRLEPRRRRWALPLTAAALALGVLLVWISRPPSAESALLAALESPDQAVWTEGTGSGEVERVAETPSVVFVRWKPRPPGT